MKMYTGKRILVTGAGGFIGSHLTESLLNKGYYVRAMVHYNFRNDWGWLEEILGDKIRHPLRKTSIGILFSIFNKGDSLEVVTGDIQDPYFVDYAVKGCKTVFHLAAVIPIPYSYIAPAVYISTNVQGTLNMLQACCRHKVDRVVHTSTSEVYGTAQYTPIDEKHPFKAQSPYAASKIGADQLAESYYCSFDLPVTIIRPFNTFGPRQSSRAIIPTIITQVISGAKSVRLGSLTPVRDLTYVEDTVNGFLAIAASDSAIGKVINIGCGNGVSIGDLAQIILNSCGSSAKIETDIKRIRPEKSEIYTLICDNKMALNILGWKPKYTLKQGLEKTIEWMRNKIHLFKPEIYNI